MPESFRETETGVVERDRQQRDKGNEPSHNIVSVIAQFADDNLSLLRNISTGLAVAGVIIIARSIKLITKFQAAHEIPIRFIERNVSLRGKVHSITEKGIEVEHILVQTSTGYRLLIPNVSFVADKFGPHTIYDASTSPLLVHLAGVELTPEGKAWLHENLASAEPVWLKLISREDDTLHCLVSQSKGSMWSCCVNEEVLRLGLARSAPIAGVLPDSRIYWRLHKRLHRAEVKAERKGRGLWKEESLWERTSKAVRDNALFRLIKRIFKRT